MADLSVVSRAVWSDLAAMGEHSAKNTLRHSAVPVGRAPDVGSQPDGPFVTSFRNGRKVQMPDAFAPTKSNMGN